MGVDCLEVDCLEMATNSWKRETEGTELEKSDGR